MPVAICSTSELLLPVRSRRGDVRGGVASCGSGGGRRAADRSHTARFGRYVPCEVARRVLETFGPVIVNDISAGEMDPAIVDVVAEYDAPYIAMHMRGTPARCRG